MNWSRPACLAEATSLNPPIEGSWAPPFGNTGSLGRALLAGFGRPANDHVFAPVYPYSVPIAQRKQNLAKAKQLLEAAGHANGFSATLTTGNESTKVAAAQVVQASAKKIGMKLKLSLPDSSVYYGGSPKTTPWLNAPLTLTTWAARPIVNQYLTATLMSGGVWNASRYHNPEERSMLGSPMKRFGIVRGEQRPS